MVSGKRIVIVAAEFNRELVDAMIEAARNEIETAGAVLVRMVRVPGSYEVPLIADLQMAQEGVGGEFHCRSPRIFSSGHRR